MILALPQKSWAISVSALPPELTPSAVAMPRRKDAFYIWAMPLVWPLAKIQRAKLGTGAQPRD
jgi:hypothetical protein